MLERCSSRPSSARSAFHSAASLAWELILQDGEIVGVVCPDCFTLREQRARRAGQDRIVRRLKRGLPLL
jgi:hypothetical protein